MDEVVLLSSKIVHILLWLRVGHVFQKTVLMAGNLYDLILVPSALDKGICSYLCLSMLTIWERYKLQDSTF